MIMPSSSSLLFKSLPFLNPKAPLSLSFSNLTMSTASPTKTRLRGVVFDMDGTLTVPVIDFTAMYKAVLGETEYKRIREENPSGIDILHHIENWGPDKQRKAYDTILDFERQGLDRLQIMPGAAELCGFLDSKKIRRGLITRNVKEAVDLFHQRFGTNCECNRQAVLGMNTLICLYSTCWELVSPGCDWALLFNLDACHIHKIMFSPALSREFRPYKPDPGPLLYICSTWEVQPNEVIMVGDSLKDDVTCGKRAGALTCLLDEKGRYGSSDFAKLGLEPDFRVSSLAEVYSLLEANFDLMP